MSTKPINTWSNKVRIRFWSVLLVVVTLLVAAAVPGFSGVSSSDNHAATILSDSVTPLAVGATLSMLLDKQNGKSEAIQTAKALSATAFATEVLKLTVRERRPQGSSLDSFPSGHTSEAFAAATMWGEYHPKYAWIGYTTAAAIGWSRVELGKHRWQDVAAGAVLGHLIAKRFANKHFYAGADGVGVQYKF